MTEQEKIGNELISMRHKLGFSSRESFLEKNNLKISLFAYSQCETGKLIKLDTLIEILKCHNMTLKQFMLNIN